MIDRINPSILNDTSAYGYSQLVKAPVSGEYIFLSGQLGEDAQGRRAVGFENQVKQSFENLISALESVDATVKNVVKITVLIVNHDEEKLQIVSTYRKEIFGKAGPASTLIPVPRLAGDWMLFEIDAIAMI